MYIGIARARVCAADDDDGPADDEAAAEVERRVMDMMLRTAKERQSKVVSCVEAPLPRRHDPDAMPGIRPSTTCPRRCYAACKQACNHAIEIDDDGMGGWWAGIDTRGGAGTVGEEHEAGTHDLSVVSERVPLA